MGWPGEPIAGFEPNLVEHEFGLHADATRSWTIVCRDKGVGRAATQGCGGDEGKSIGRLQ